MKKLLCTAGGLCFALLHGIGQVSPAFQNLNFSSCTSGYFWTQSNYEGLPPDGSTYAMIDHSDASSILFNFRMADITPQSTLVPDYGALRDELNAIRRDQGVIPIVIAELEYQRLSEAAFDHGWLFATPEGIFQSPQSGNIFATERTLTLLVDMPKYRRGAMTFRLQPSHYLQNMGSLPSTIRLDFDDGQGWRTVVPGQLIHVNYSGQFGEKQIRLEVVREGSVLRSGLRSSPVPCVSNYDDPDPIVPWTTTGNPDMPWEISTVIDGVTVLGNAYYLPSGQFDKPFIFVEGIDFSYEVSAQRNGDFGWCEFTSGMDVPGYAFNMLKLMPNLLDAVRANGYDIILLDFRDGATWIQHNAALLRHLISMVNAIKSGTQQNVVAGASMGGQVSRYALATMEQDGEDHCTRLWISLDSPHTGAYIPISLQQTLFTLSADYHGARDFINGYLKRPASKQLLNMQLNFSSGATLYSPESRNDWYSELDQLGYPRHCRSIAVANGSMTGVPIQPGLLNPLLNYSCEASPTLTGPELLFLLLPSSGLPMMTSILPGSVELITARIIYTRNRNLNDLAGQIASLLTINVSKVSATFTASPETPVYDYAPGGRRGSIRTFIESMNRSLRYSSCPEIALHQASLDHSFIPTASALGISGVNPFDNLEALLDQGVISCPFDRLYAPRHTNEAHSEVSERGLAEVLDEILGGENEYGEPLIPLEFTPSAAVSSVFNFGRSAVDQLGSTAISGGARVHINDHIPTHFGSPSDSLPIFSHFTVHTLKGCNGSLIRVNNMGVLSLGNAVEGRTGELVIGKGSVLRFEAGGSGVINQGSRIVVESGGELFLESGSLLRNQGEIVLKEGSKLVYGGGIFRLEGVSARLILDGGQLHTLPGAHLEFVHEGVPGIVEVRGGGGHDLFCGQNSSVRISGNGPNSVILRVTDWSNLWNGNFGLGHLYLNNGVVDLSNNGQIWLDMRITATNVHFKDLSPNSGFATIQSWYANGTYTNCTFQGAQVIGQDSRIQTEQCVFDGQKSGIRMQGGMYRVGQTQFRDCGIHSQGLQNPSLIEQSSFQAILGFANDGRALFDHSLTAVTMNNNTITGAVFGIQKIGGQLVLACNTLAGNLTAIQVGNGCRLSMDANSNAGYNRLANNNLHIDLKNAGGVAMANGYNHFGVFASKMIKGTIAGIACPDNCSSPVLHCPRNTWGANGSAGAPNPAWFEIFSGSFSLPCSTPPSLYFCPILINDPTPFPLATCRQHVDPITIVKPQRSATILGAVSAEREIQESHQFSTRSGNEGNSANPLIYTPSFDGVALEDALIEAASQLEAYDSTASNLNAVHLFHEVLTADLDRTHPEVRWKMIWGRDQMKSAFERLVLDGIILPEENTHNFTQPVQQFVDVLNLMTDSVLTDSTYRSQFYLELDKGQLFRTLGRSDIARQVFIHLGDCQLDSLEQATLNAWRAQCDLDLLIRDQYVEQGLAPEDIMGEADQTDFVLPVSHISDTYYFGLHIFGPQDLEFVSCQSEWVLKSGTRDNQPSFSIHPNPARAEITVRCKGIDTPVQLELFDTSGRLCFTQRIPEGSANLCPVALPPHLSSGVYALKLRTEGWYDSQLLVIE